MAEALIDPQVEDAFRIEVGGERRFHPLASLTYSEPVPGYRDVLWMFPSDLARADVEKEWELMRIAMENRLRWAGEGGTGEFIQAAATHLVFVEANAIYQDLA